MESAQSWIWPIVMPPEHKAPPPAVVQSGASVVAYPQIIDKNLPSRVNTAEEISRCFDKQHDMDACVEKYGAKLMVERNIVQPCALSDLNPALHNCFNPTPQDAAIARQARESFRKGYLRVWQNRVLNQITEMESWFIAGSTTEVKSGAKCTTSCIVARKNSPRVVVRCDAGTWRYSSTTKAKITCGRPFKK